jgi:hypothetical protein
MKAELFQARFKGGALGGITFSVEVGQMVLYSVEVREDEEIKHRYEFQGGEFIYGWTKP